MKKKIIALILCLISFLISNLKAQEITGNKEVTIKELEEIKLYVSGK